MPDWYPGCKVRLKIRLEDTNLGIVPPLPSVAPPEQGAESFGSGSINDIVPGGGFITIGQDFVPRSCTVELNSYRKADTAKLTIDLARLPVDPRLIRAMTVQIFGGSFTPAEYAAANGTPGAEGILLPDLPSPLTGVAASFGGVTNELFRGFADMITVSINDTSQTMSLDARDLTGELLDAEIPPNMLRDIPGFLTIDEVIQLLITGDSLASVTQDARLNDELYKPLGRQRRELLKEARLEFAAADVLDADGLPEAAAAARAAGNALKQSAAAISAQIAPPASRRFGLPGFRGVKVRNEVAIPGDPTGEITIDLPTISEVRPKAWLDSGGTARKGRKRGVGGKQKISFWDFVNELVNSAGYIVFVRTPNGPTMSAAEIVISNPRTYYRQATAAGDVFPPPTSTRTFVYGLNVPDLTFKRSLKGVAVPTILIRGFDQATGIRYSGLYPPLPKNNRATPTGAGDRTEIKQFNFDQITGGSPDEIVANLNRAAASIYEQLGRGDLEVSLKTTALAALPENLDKGIVSDLFALRPKDPISVELPAQDPTTGVVSSGLILDSADLGARLEQARQIGLDPATAVLLAGAASSEYLQKEFRTRTVTATFDADAGWDFTISAINYLDVRDSIQITTATAGTDVSVSGP